MARLNVRPRVRNQHANEPAMLKTHEGAPATPIRDPEEQLRRLVLSCLLWEKEFYVDGKAIADLIVETAEQCNPAQVASLAIEARETFNLRHVPLLLLDVLCGAPTREAASIELAEVAGFDGVCTIADVVYRVIQRADELTELLAIHWRNGKRPIPAQMRKGLRRAFAKFKEYHFAKYDRDGSVKLRDVLRLVRPSAKEECPDEITRRATPKWIKERNKLYEGVKNRSLKAPDTWEVALSSGADKRETFERLIRENKLGYFALLRNLRNMEKAGCDEKLVTDAIIARKNGAERILPFRYIAAARAAPNFEPALDKAMLDALKDVPKLAGKTAVLVDVSGSMDWKLSQRSDLKRIDAAAGLAALIQCSNKKVFSFSQDVVRVPPRTGMAEIDAIVKSQAHGGTYLGAAVRELDAMGFDRLIVITDEQSHDPVPEPKTAQAYMINVASNRNGVSHTPGWLHLDGFSENVIRYIFEHEANEARRRSLRH